MTSPSTLTDVLQLPRPTARQDSMVWSDPYVARMLARHRLQAALDDSLAFMNQHQTTPSVRFDRAG